MNLLKYGAWTYTEKVHTLISNHIFYYLASKKPLKLVNKSYLSIAAEKKDICGVIENDFRVSQTLPLWGFTNGCLTLKLLSQSQISNLKTQNNSQITVCGIRSTYNAW